MIRTTGNKSVWEERWSILDAKVARLARCFAEETDLSLPRKTTIYSALTHLQAFAGSHFRFFHDSFNDSGRYRLKKSKAYPPDHVLSIILLQMANDIELIERAADERLLDEVCASYQARTILEKTDRLAMEALKPAMDMAIIPANTTVVTYFQKSTSVRLIPYAPIAFIGLPYTAVSLSRDRLAIPHEAAHYVYRHGVVPGNGRFPIDTYLWHHLQDEPFWLRYWLEEIFSDVYGCLIGGPVMALDFQDLQISSSGSEFIRDYEDEEDPVPLLRPDIYSKTLKAKSQVPNPQQTRVDQWGRLADQLHTHWRRRRRQQIAAPPSADGDITFTTKNSTVTLKEAMSLNTSLDADKPLDKAIHLILHHVLPQLVQGIHSDWSGNAATLSKVPNVTPDVPADQMEHVLKKDNDALGHLYRNFDDYLQTFDKRPKPEEFNDYAPEPEKLDTANGIAPLWTEWVQKYGFFGFDEKGAGQMPPTDKVIPEAQWKPLISARYWVTRGPQGNPTGT